ncbi:MAG: class I SAM-dependent methyltransferase [Anaerolineae bacterium]
MTGTDTGKLAAEPVWRRYLTDYNEGLGLVYERLILNDYLEGLKHRFGLERVLEAPLYGMAGVSGINSVHLARLGCAITLMDTNEERLQGVQRIWAELGLEADFRFQPTLGSLPFADGSFDLAWQWAGLWYLQDAEALLRELCRVSGRLVFVAMPNPRQPGYLLRKYVAEPEFFRGVDESWTDIGRVRRVLETCGYRVIERGVMDVPPWPDTVMPVAELLQRLGIRSERLQQRFSGDSWEWSTMDYYLGRQPDLRERVLRHAWLERSRLPAWLKGFWAHHRYLLAERG